MSAQSGFQLSGSAPDMYERYIVSTLTAALAQDLVTLAALKPGEHILDVACGTGTVTRQAAQCVFHAKVATDSTPNLPLIP
jgi:ubiquinone/menaquinone biosynthesis C-methylase UbiE